jgi:hypothetical protein
MLLATTVALISKKSLCNSESVLRLMISEHCKHKATPIVQIQLFFVDSWISSIPPIQELRKMNYHDLLCQTGKLEAESEKTPDSVVPES